MPPNVTRFLYCRCSCRSNVIPPKTRAALDAACEGTAVWQVDDLCRLAAAKDPRLAEFAAQDAPVVIACHARAVRALFDAAGSPLSDSATILNARTDDAATVLQATGDLPTSEAPPRDTSDESWVPWFPVIDHSRCTNCKQCLNFCLFGTYELNEMGQVEVVRPDACKLNCPACARICPAVAIVFPKYDGAPIDGGPIEDEAAEKERVKVDTRKILGSDIYAGLRQRQAKRALLSDETRREQEEKAHAERERWRADRGES